MQDASLDSIAVHLEEGLSHAVWQEKKEWFCWEMQKVLVLTSKVSTFLVIMKILKELPNGAES